MLGSDARMVRPAHTGISCAPLNSWRHLMTRELVHQKFDR
jgi:hypothetical protein